MQGKLHYIAVLAKALTVSQRNYPVTKRELLAVIWALQRLREYFYGHKVIVYTDHKALQFLLTQKQINYMTANWADILIEFNLSIVHRPGITMVLPDALSRLFSSKEKGEVDCPPKQKPAKNHSLRVSKFALKDGESNPKELHQFIKERLGKSTPEESERPDILARAHLAGHLGAEGMFKQLWWKGLYWPTLREECKAVADNCTECQQHNIQRQGFHPMSSIHASLPWEHIALDLAGPLKTSKQGYNMILVITDICTRFTIIRPLRSKMAKDVAKELFHVMADFGVPKIIQSDNGSEFVNSTIHEMKSLLGVQHRLISPYHPEANGVAEASVKVAKQLLTKNSKGDLLHWERYLPMVQMQMNCRIMNRTGSQPFELCHGRPWNDWSDYSECQSKPLSTNELLERCKGLKNILYHAVLNKRWTKADTEKK